MDNEVCGIPFESFEDPTQTVLKKYAEWSYGELEFDLKKATEFQYDPETQLVRSRSLIRQIGRFATQLDIFILPPERDLCRVYSKQEKESIDTEVYLAIASKKLRPEKPVAKFTGHLAVLRASDDGFREVGHLGQTKLFFDYVTEHNTYIPPEATVIRGEHGSLEEIVCGNERFGDNCKIVNNVPDTLQICGLVSLSSEEVEKGSGLLKALLRPKES